MKPHFHGKTLLTVIALSFISQLSSAQSCDEPRRPAIVAYLQYKGAGWEMGWWPEGSSLGFFAGMGVSKQPILLKAKPDSVVEIIGTEVYGKFQLRLFERVALTASLGTLNGQKLYYASGIRFNLPVNNKTAVMAEPLIGNRGFNLQLGLAKRF